MRVAGYKRLVVCKKYPWKIFEQNVTAVCFKNEPLEVFCKKRALENLFSFTEKYCVQVSF